MLQRMATWSQQILGGGQRIDPADVMWLLCKGQSMTQPSLFVLVASAHPSRWKRAKRVLIALPAPPSLQRASPARPRFAIGKYSYSTEPPSNQESCNSWLVI